MGFFESLFYMIWRGIAIGILISAPMGPVGILCIQRTLDKGRRTGFYTGVGAAISDLLYCLLTGFGLSFIEEFIERNQNVIQLLGSAVLIGFGIYLLKKNPAKSLRKPDIQECSPKKSILGGFLFTFSNPLILFLIIGLFARFNFLVPDIKFYHYIVGFVSIVAGALGWWWIVTFSIDKVRAHFNLRSMWLINRIIGIIILLFAFVGIITGISNLASATNPPPHGKPDLRTNANRHWNKGRGYAPFQNISEEGLHLDNTSYRPLIDSVNLTIIDQVNPVPATDFSLSFRVDNRHGHPSRKYLYRDARNNTLYRKTPPWAFFIADKNGKHCWITVTKAIGNDDDLSSNPSTVVAVTTDNMERPIAERSVKENVVPFAGESLWRVEMEGKKLTVISGRHDPTQILELPLNFDGITSFGFASSPGGEIVISDISFLPANPFPCFPLSPDSLSSLNNFTSSNLTSNLNSIFKDSEDPIEGFWEIFDRTLDESLLMLGGSYKLAIVKNHDRYDIIYLDGARVNGYRWKPGMVKGYLHPSSFPGLYNLEWIDAEGKSLSNSITAQTGEGETLLLQFPYHSSTLRLRKVE